MKKQKKKKIIGLVILVLALIIFCIIYIFINGKQYSIYTHNLNHAKADETIEIKYSEEGIVKNVNIEKMKYSTKFTFESIKPGKTNITIGLVKNESNTGEYVIKNDYTLTVNEFNVIVMEEDEYVLFAGSKAIIASIIIFMVVIEIMLVLESKKKLEEKEYSYKTINTIGLCLYIAFFIIVLIYILIQCFIHPEYYNFYAIYFAIRVFFEWFVFISMPFITILSILLIKSNVKLLKTEGYRLANILGIVISLMLMIGAVIAILFPSKHKSWFDISETLSAIFCYFECMYLGAMWCGIKAAKNKPNYPKGYIIILGCGIAKDGSLLPLLQGRVDKAIEFYNNQYKETGKKAIFIPSGGQGPDECISEAEAMKKYMLEKGIEEEQIVIENKSTTTYENMKFSKKLIDENNKNNEDVIFSTTNYHVFRSGIYAKEVGLKAEGIGSETKWYFWPNAFVREFVGMLFANKKKHIFIVILLSILTIGINCIMLSKFS